MRTGFIYKIINNETGKIYIGQTITSIRERWSGHKCDSKRKNTPLYASMRKSQNIDEDFTIEIIEENISYERLDSREIYWIRELSSMHPNGYNLSGGGQSYLTEEERHVMSERVSGENNPMYGMHGDLNPFFGRKHSEETKRLISEAGIGREVSSETREKIAKSTRLRHKRLGHPMQGKITLTKRE